MLFEALISTPDVQHAFLGALIGGIFARKDAKKKARLMEEAAKVPMVTETEHELDLGAMNAHAEANGYNPMTVLMAGGLSAFTKTKNTTTGHNAMAAAEARGNVPSFGSVLSGALSSTIDSLAGAAFSSMAPMSKSFFPAAPASAGGMAEALGWATSTKTAAGGLAGGGGARFTATPALASASGKAGQYIMPEFEAPSRINPHYGLKIDPTSASAEDWEKEYSEAGGWYGGFENIYNNVMYNLTGTTRAGRTLVAIGAANLIGAGALSPTNVGEVLSKGVANRYQHVKDWVEKTNGSKGVKDNFGDPFPKWAW